MPVISPAHTVAAVAPTLAAPTRSQQEGALCPNPIFILGAPRSGTSILNWALAQHPQLWAGAESNLLYHLFGNGHVDTVFETLHQQHGSSWLRDEGVERAELLRHLGTGVNALYSSRSGGRRWIDKSIQNTLMVDIVGEMFPGASFIHIVRDGRAAVHSMVHASFPYPTCSDFQGACQTWVTSVQRAGDFCAAHPRRCLEVSYERLVADPEGEFRRMLRFLGLAVDQSPARFFRSNRINSSFEAGSENVAKSVDAIYWEDWTDEQRLIFWHEAATTLRDYGHVSGQETNALRPHRAAPLPQASQRGVHQADPGERPSVVPAAPTSVTRSLQQELREQSAQISELAAAVATQEATIRALRAAHAEQATRARRYKARLTRLESRLPVRLYRWARNILPSRLGGYSAAG